MPHRPSRRLRRSPSPPQDEAVGVGSSINLHPEEGLRSDPQDRISKLRLEGRIPENTAPGFAHVMKCHDSLRWLLPSLCGAAARAKQTSLYTMFFCTFALPSEAASPAGTAQTAARRRSDFVHIMFLYGRQALFSVVTQSEFSIRGGAGYPPRQTELPPRLALATPPPYLPRFRPHAARHTPATQNSPARAGRAIAERCRSGRTGRSRKPLCALRTVGSNPTLSAIADTNFVGKWTGVVTNR